MLEEDDSDYKRIKENLEKLNKYLKQEKERFNKILKMNFYDVVFTHTDKTEESSKKRKIEENEKNDQKRIKNE